MQGRLTLSPGESVPTADQIGKQVLYYGPCGQGKSLSIYSGGSWGTYDYTSGPTDQVGLSLDLAGSANWPAGSIHDVFAILIGGIPCLATRQWDADMFETEAQIPAGTTITTGTGAAAWLRPAAAFDGAVPQAMAASARTPVPPGANSGNANFLGQAWAAPRRVSRLQISACSDNNLNGTATTALHTIVYGSNDGANWNFLTNIYLDVSMFGGTYSVPINFSNQQPYLYHRVGFDGTPGYSLNVAEIQFFERVAPLTRRLTMLDGRWVNDSAITARTDASTTVSVAQYEATYLGTIQVDDTDGQITCHTEYGPDRRWGVYNAFNQKRVTLRAGIITPNASSYTVTQNRWGPIQSGGYNLKVLQGLPGDFVNAKLIRGVYINAYGGRKAYEAGIGVDTTLSFSGQEISLTQDMPGQQNGYMAYTANLTLPAFFGSRHLHGIERTDTGAGTASSFVDQRSSVLCAEWMG